MTEHAVLAVSGSGRAIVAIAHPVIAVAPHAIVTIATAGRAAVVAITAHAIIAITAHAIIAITSHPVVAISTAPHPIIAVGGARRVSASGRKLGCAGCAAALHTLPGRARGLRVQHRGRADDQAGRHGDREELCRHEASLLVSMSAGSKTEFSDASDRQRRGQRGVPEMMWPRFLQASSSRESGRTASHVAKTG
jgi:hypothetical protein